MSMTLVHGGRRRRLATALPFILPAMVLYLLLVVGPMLFSFIMSFYDWQIARSASSSWVGLRNYRRAFADPIFRRAAANTVTYSMVTVPAQIVAGLLVAVLLNQRVRAKGAFRFIFYLPVITNWVIVGVLFRYAFNAQAGLVNYVLRDVLGVVSVNVRWLADPHLALVPVHLVEIWKGVGWCAIIYLAALQTVPSTLIEAAVVDGAGRLRRFFSIVVPVVAPTTLFLVVVRTIGTLNGYVSNVIITDGGNPMDQTHFILTLMYDAAFGNLDFGYGAAISYFLTLLVLLISLVQIRLLRSGDDTI